MPDPQFHQQTAASCFNQCWELIEKADRTPLEEEEMRRLSEVSYFHWTQHPDFDAEKDSVGLWQLARVYAISGLLPQARAYAERCLKVSLEGGLSDFLVGYAQEAVARVAALEGDRPEAEQALSKAQDCLAQCADEEMASYLKSDLEGVRALLRT
jgi:hypothetical protein